MLAWTIDPLGSAHACLYQLTWEDQALDFARTLEQWRNSSSFRRQFLELLRDAPFRSFRWECPPISQGSLDRRFEFVLWDDPGLRRSPDLGTFSDHFDEGDSPHGIVSFRNLGGDAMLVVPTPHGPPDAYVHLAAFVHGAPDEQQHALLASLGAAVERELGEDPLWLSTAGGGVAWLHVRLDSYPKYYSYRPYTEFA